MDAVMKEKSKWGYGRPFSPAPLSSNHHGATTNCLRNLSREEWMVPASIAPSGVGGEGRNLEVEWCEVLRVAAGVLVVGRAGGGGGGRGRGEVHP